MNPNAGEPVIPGGAVPPNPLANLEGVVAAAQQEAAAAQATPRTQFEDQFGSGATPPVAESAPDLMDQALANPEPAPPAVDVSTPLEQTQPTAEALAQPELEKTPADILKQEISDSVDAFLEEVTKEKVAA